MKKPLPNRKSNRSKEKWRLALADVENEDNRKLLKEFLETGQTRKGRVLGPATKLTCAYTLKDLSNTLDKQYEDIREEDLRQYIEALRDRKHPKTKKALKHNTINKARINLRMFFRWLWSYKNSGDVRDNPAFNLPLDIDNREPFYLSPGEVNAMIQAIEDKGDKRDEAMIKTLFYTGIRSDEMINLSVVPHPERNYFDMDRGIIHINISKSKEPRKFKIPDWSQLKPVIEEYIRNHRIEPDPKKDQNNPLFTSSRRKALGYDRLNIIFRETAVKACINRLEFFPERTFKDITPHLARKSFGTSYIRRGGNVVKLKYILGHQRLETTLIYVGLVRAELDKDDVEIGLYNPEPASSIKPSIPIQETQNTKQDYPTPMHAEKKGFDMAYM